MTKKGPISPWINEYVLPMLDAYWANDIDWARRAHETALASLETEPDADIRKAKWMRLTTPWLGLLLEHGGFAEGEPVLAELMLAWAGPQPGPESAEIACVTQLMTRLHLHHHDWLELPEDEASRLIAAVPERLRGGNFWSEVGVWAFLRRDRELMELSVSHFSNDPPPKLESWFYHYTLLMYRLLVGIADGEDVERVAGLVENQPQLRDLERFVLPECRRQGLVTPRAVETLAAKYEQYAA